MASCFKLAFYSSTVTMMHGLINIRYLVNFAISILTSFRLTSHKAVRLLHPFKSARAVGIMHFCTSHTVNTDDETCAFDNSSDSSPMGPFGTAVRGGVAFQFH